MLSATAYVLEVRGVLEVWVQLESTEDLQCPLCAVRQSLRAL